MNTSLQRIAVQVQPPFVHVVLDADVLLPANVHGVQAQVRTADPVHDDVKVDAHAVVVAARRVDEQLLREF